MKLNLFTRINIGFVLTISFLFSYGQKGAKPNVLFIVADDLRPSIGCYGDLKAITPHIDKLAASSIVFNNAYCQQAVCNPSRASVLTGLRPNQNGVTDLVTHFREKVPDAVTLPQAFKNAGYTTIGIGKIFHGTKQTLDKVSWSISEIENVSVKNQEYFLERNKKGGKADAFEFTEGPDNKYPDGKIAESTIELLRDFKKSGKPFFLATGFKKPHLPFCAPQKYWDMYKHTDFSGIANSNKPLGAPEIAFHQWQELRGYTDIADQGPLTPQKQRDLIHAYYACISYVDVQLGKIIDELDKLGLSDNTIIVLWGDHGYHLGEQDLWCKSTNFELDTRIPLIISAPSVIKKASNTNAVVEAIDIYPTLIDLCGLTKNTALTGKSLKPLLQQPQMKWDQVAYSQFCRPYKAITSKYPTHMGYTVRDQNYRYTLWYNLHNDSIEHRELYDLRKSRLENENLAGTKKYQQEENRLAAMLEAYRHIN
ncbi:sulfatase [Niabella ginsengisoli]|uniref:Sulfatase n=1 Tax=Niabella ginsengisoli TaxID=522298 RepID=A0ABS9SN83_9BACT|nr:sulfatase [Niabella ginsengisoli]MCH5599817.1 sulfatase [Niabella ginsengisoli]